MLDRKLEILPAISQSSLLWLSPRDLLPSFLVFIKQWKPSSAALSPALTCIVIPWGSCENADFHSVGGWEVDTLFFKRASKWSQTFRSTWAKGRSTQVPLFFIFLHDTRRAGTIIASLMAVAKGIAEASQSWHYRLFWARWFFIMWGLSVPCGGV